MTHRFQDKVVLVTGASSGIGKVAALAFAREGAKVAIAARRVDQGMQTVTEIKQDGGMPSLFKPMSPGRRTCETWSL